MAGRDRAISCNPKLIGGKRGPTRLGFAILLRFYTERGRFPHVLPYGEVKLNMNSRLALGG
jgi:hypothetical protein